MRVGAAEEIGLKQLRRLGEPQVFAGHGAFDVPSQVAVGGFWAEDRCERVGLGVLDGLAGGLLEGVGERDSGDDRWVVAGSGDDAIDELMRETRSSGIVDSDMGCRIGHGFEEGLDALVAVVFAAPDEGDTQESEGVGVADAEGLKPIVAGGARESDMADLGIGVGIVDEGVEGSVEDGPAAEVFIEFGSFASGV